MRQARFCKTKAESEKFMRQLRKQGYVGVMQRIAGFCKGAGYVVTWEEEEEGDRIGR